MAKLSQRLQTILDFSLRGKDFWDLCCDHGQLGEQALNQNIASHVHFVDQVEHIMLELKRRLRNPAMTLHLKSAENIDQAMTGNVAISGVGGNTIVKILKNLDANCFLRADRIIVNPATRREVFEDFLQDWPSYQLSQKYLFNEGGLERSVYVLDRNPKTVSS